MNVFEQALLNTLMGMGTVFAVLIFISLLISLFVYFPKKNCNFSVRFLKIFCSYAEPCEMEDGRKIASRKIIANSGNIVEKKYQKW